MADRHVGDVHSMSVLELMQAVKDLREDRHHMVLAISTLTSNLDTDIMINGVALRDLGKALNAVCYPGFRVTNMKP